MAGICTMEVVRGVVNDAIILYAAASLGCLSLSCHCPVEHVVPARHLPCHPARPPLHPASSFTWMSPSTKVVRSMGRLAAGMRDSSCRSQNTVASLPSYPGASGSGSELTT